MEGKEVTRWEGERIKVFDERGWRIGHKISIGQVRQALYILKRSPPFQTFYKLQHRIFAFPPHHPINDPRLKALFITEAGMRSSKYYPDSFPLNCLSYA